jgi:hypothetical protein
MVALPGRIGCQALMPPFGLRPQLAHTTRWAATMLASR